MIRGYHIILTTYGFWLPNDPRGSWSREVYAPNLRPFGEATKTNTRRSVASKSHDVVFRVEAKQALKYPPVTFTGKQARAVGRGFSQIVQRLQISVVACAIMPDHVHLVVLRHGLTGEQIAAYRKRAATRSLKTESLWNESRSPWAKKSWCVFLDTDDDVRRCMRYTENNPIKAGLKPQRWNFLHPCPV